MRDVAADGMLLRDAVCHFARDPRRARIWYALSLKQSLARDLGPLSNDRFQEWVTLDIALTNDAIELLRSGEWTADGTRPGVATPECPARDWWRRDIELDLWGGSVVWNGVELHGIMVRSTHQTQPGVTVSQSPRRLPAKDVAAWMLRHATDHLRTKKAKLTREDALKACREEFPGRVSVRIATNAYANLPKYLKYGRGEQHKSML